jgi:hypothetical protein
MSHGQNLNSTSGEPEFVAQYFFEIPASESMKETPRRRITVSSSLTQARKVNFIGFMWH